MLASHALRKDSTPKRYVSAIVGVSAMPTRKAGGTLWPDTILTRVAGHVTRRTEPQEQTAGLKPKGKACRGPAPYGQEARGRHTFVECSPATPMLGRSPLTCHGKPAPTWEPVVACPAIGTWGAAGT